VAAPVPRTAAPAADRASALRTHSGRPAGDAQTPAVPRCHERA